MGIILTVSSSKGGGGKTTLAALAAVRLASDGYRVTVIDADPNATYSDWHHTNYEGPDIACLAETDNIAVIQRAQDAADARDVVIIDTAGFANLTAASAIGTADAVLIPCMPDRGSVRETLRTVRQVESLVAASRRPIPYRVVRMDWSARGLAEQSAETDLTDAKVPLLSLIIPPIAALRRSTFTGSLPTSGRGDEIAVALITELRKIKFIPAKPKRN